MDKTLTPPLENRYKIISVPEEQILNLFNGFFCEDNGCDDTFELPIIKERWPKSATAMSGNYNYYRKTFEILLWDRSFEIVPAGSTIPLLDIFDEIQTVRIPVFIKDAILQIKHKEFNNPDEA